MLPFFSGLFIPVLGEALPKLYSPTISSAKNLLLLLMVTMMGSKSHFGAALALVLLSSFLGANGQDQTMLVPAIITFGDSTVDVGNNNYLATAIKADFPPYGRDFTNHQPTGRFCNGKLATDITGKFMNTAANVYPRYKTDTLGFTTYPPAYLSPQASGKNLLIGANFASAASGYYDKTAFLYHAISLSQQLEYYKEYQTKLAKVAGSKKAASILSEALYILSAGSSDFVQNYYINPYLYKFYTADEFSTQLVQIFSNFVQVRTLDVCTIYRFTVTFSFSPTIILL
ncbi:hypothetical protein ACLOJK_020992 [Asimina triloba]